MSAAKSFLKTPTFVFTNLSTLCIWFIVLSTPISLLRHEDWRQRQQIASKTSPLATSRLYVYNLFVHIDRTVLWVPWYSVIISRFYKNMEGLHILFVKSESRMAIYFTWIIREGNLAFRLLRLVWCQHRFVFSVTYWNQFHTTMAIQKRYRIKDIKSSWGVVFLKLEV